MPGLPDHHLLERYVALADEPMPCPCCGHDLRGLHGNRCGGCNRALRLIIGPEPPLPMVQVLGLLPLAGGLGFHTIALLALATERSSYAPQSVAVFLVIGLLVFSGALTGWIRRWEKTGQAQRQRQVRWVAACWLAAAANALLAVMFFVFLG